MLKASEVRRGETYCFPEPASVFYSVMLIMGHIAFGAIRKYSILSALFVVVHYSTHRNAYSTHALRVRENRGVGPTQFQ